MFIIDVSNMEHVEGYSLVVLNGKKDTSACYHFKCATGMRYHSLSSIQLCTMSRKSYKLYKTTLRQVAPTLCN